MGPPPAPDTSGPSLTMHIINHLGELQQRCALLEAHMANIEDRVESLQHAARPVSTCERMLRNLGKSWRWLMGRLNLRAEFLAWTRTQTQTTWEVEDDVTMTLRSDV